MSLSMGEWAGLIRAERTPGVVAVSESGQGGRGNTLPLSPTNSIRIWKLAEPATFYQGGGNETS